MPPALPQVLQDLPLNHPKLEKLKSRDGRVQLAAQHGSEAVHRIAPPAQRQAPSAIRFGDEFRVSLLIARFLARKDTGNHRE